MVRLFGLSQGQVARIRPFFPKERGGKRVDDRKVLSGIIHVIQKGLRWVDAPADLIFSELSASDAIEPPDSAEPEVLMIDATDIKAHPTASSLNKGGTLA